MQILREARRTCSTRTIVAQEKFLARGTCCCSRLFLTKQACFMMKNIHKTYMSVYKLSSKQPIKESKGGRDEQNLTEPTPFPKNGILEGARKYQYKFELH